MNKILSKEIKLEIKGPKKIGIIGRNGTGKTTLLNLIYEEIKKDDRLIVSYMPQEYEKEFDLQEVGLDYLKKVCDDETVIRAFMGNMKFTREEMEYKIKSLSGGQKAKLILLKMFLNKSNVMILDEPTRNLSPLSNPVVRKILSEYEGAIISVSHDRKYLKEVCDSIYYLNEDGLHLSDII
ncbi:MAG: ATP-binding cassette domain-containing protein [Bacilli bacterium]|nr:ATP-binding cassette domain-containing protein [Bacilli bacterium]